MFFFQNPDWISQVDNLVPPQAIEEICRYGNTQLNVIASILGGTAAQEAIKLVTHQYIPLNNALIYDGHSQYAAKFRI